MNNIEKHSDKDWEKLASLLSGETNGPSEELGRFRVEDNYNTEKQWKEMGKIGNDNRIDVDKAWNNIYSRIEENGLLSKTVRPEKRYNLNTIMRIAAVALILIGFGVTMFYLNNNGTSANKIVVAANSLERIIIF
jgi:hypothetical protein